jgi:acyl carrier protein
VIPKTKEGILEQIKKTLVDEFECDPAKITPEARFYEDLDLDSIDAVDLVVRLRNTAGVEVSPEDFKSIRTVGDLLGVLEKLYAKNA